MEMKRGETGACPPTTPIKEERVKKTKQKQP